MKTTLILCALTTGLAMGEETYKLTYKLEAGATYLSDQKANVQMAMPNPMSQEAMNIHTKTSSLVSFVTKKVKNGMQVEAQIKEFSMDTSSPEMEAMSMSYDSKDPESGNSPIGQMMGPLLEMKPKVVLDAEGKIVGDVDAGSKELAMAAEQMGMSATQIMETVTEGYQILPAQPVKIGDTWSAEKTTSLGSGMDSVTVNIDYTLEGVENLDGREVAKVSYTTELDTSVDMAGMAMTMKSTKFEGFSLFDLQQQLIVENVLSADMSISVPQGAQTGPTAMQSIPFSMEMTSTLKKVK